MRDQTQVQAGQSQPRQDGGRDRNRDRNRRRGDQGGQPRARGETIDLRLYQVQREPDFLSRAAAAVRDHGARVYRPGHEQIVLMSWMSTAGGELDVLGTPSLTPTMAVLAVGFSGLMTAEHKNVPEVLCVAAQTVVVEDPTAAPEYRYRLATGTPIVRAVTSGILSDQTPDPTGRRFRGRTEWKLAHSAAALTFQLFAYLADPDRWAAVTDQACLTGPVPLAIRTGLTPDAAPATVLVPFAQAVRETPPGGPPPQLVFDCQRMTPAADIRVSDGAPAGVIPGAAPWRIAMGHVRALFDHHGPVTVQYAV